MSGDALDARSLVAGVLEGDEAAARALMERLHPLVLKLVRAHLPRRSSEEDLVQTAFMKIFAKLGQYSLAVPLEHWVSRVTINSCLNQIASERARPEMRFSDLDEPQRRVIEELAASADDIRPDRSLAAKDIVEKLLSLLCPRDRLLLTLLHMDGRSAREVEKLTGWNGIAIRVRAYRARKKLKLHLEKLMEDRKR